MALVRHLMVIPVLFLVLAGCNGNSTSGPTVDEPGKDPQIEEPQYDRPATLQAEDAPIKNGGREIPRSNAEGAAVWHLDKNQEIGFPFANLAAANWQITVRYSNDDTGTLDLLRVYVDGAQVGFYKTRSTGTAGNGWNVFTVSPSVALGMIGGAKTITLRLTASDGYGIDIDSVTFTTLP
ncbi:MAG: hypothetical protein HY825_20040 [Acidobacteria bacterium]|nr:hypothetical protein [Acidobacteriota bacterium]